jgi:ATP-dependent helicase/nuclease subunit B
MADSPAPQIYNIAAGQAFLPCLAATLLDEAAREALFGTAALTDFEILLPTRRAARDLAGHFLQHAAAHGQKAILLPHIRTLGDLDDDAPGPEAADQALSALPPAISAMARHYHLLTLIRAWAARTGQVSGYGAGGLNPVKLSALAFDLEQFLDQAQNEQLDWAKLPALAPDELAANWQQTLAFLEIITAFWPKMLDELQLMDPTARRNALLAARRKQWRDTPPSHPVIAAGSTGSIRATADLLALVARLPRGAVVLPGLDMTVDAAHWDAISHTVSHPQYALAQLLEHIGAQRGDVMAWPGAAPQKPHADILGLALAPAEMTAQWAHHYGAAARPSPALHNTHLIEAPDPQSEAGAIAVVMRHCLQTPDKTAALVTRDRNLARRVAAQLQRWGITVDDSAGAPLANQPATNLLRRILACATSHFAPVDLLAVLKHPFVHLGRARGGHMALTRQLEKRLLRGPRHSGGLAGLRAALAAKTRSEPQDAALDGFVQAVQTAFVPLEGLGHPARLDAHIDALLAVASALMAPPPDDDKEPDEKGETTLYAGEAGKALAHLLDELRTQADLAGPIEAADWPALFDMWLYRQPVRQQGSVSPRLMILGPLEARLMQADVMILGGLNEGSWPPLPETGPWLSRPMRAALGMSQPERQIGQAAHDFVQSASADEVYMSRAQKVDGTPAVAARWLRRLETLCGGLDKTKGDFYLACWQALDAEAEAPRPPAAPPMPCPPLAARPDRLSVTQIETLLRNPYEIYAKKILDLREWDAVDAPVSPAARGSLVHELFERFIATGAHQKPDAAARFMALVAQLKKTRPGVEALLTFWQARLEAIGDWLAAHEQARAAFVRASHVELSGSLRLDLPDGPFTVTAKADRIDQLADGGFEIIDYKTGAPPSAKKVMAHENPQLTLEAAILAKGGFATPQGALRRTTSPLSCTLSYWQISGAMPPAKIAAPITPDAELIDGAVAMVSQLINAYRDATRPYPAHIRPGRDAGAYDHLARRAEWRRIAEEDSLDASPDIAADIVGEGGA